MRIDAHQHFWRFRPADYPWMSEGMSVLRRNWLPADLAPLLRDAGFDASVAVQARADEAETDFLLGLADETRSIAAVIGWVDLRSDHLEHRLAHWRAKPKLKGFRHQVQDEADAAAFLADAKFLRGVRLLQERRHVYEVLVFSHQLPAAAGFCVAADRHLLVLDHCGKPAIRAAEHDTWRAKLEPFRQLKHVLCKLSGLVTEAMQPDGHCDARNIPRYLDTAFEIFGPERVLFGSDWPVCLLAASYEDVYRSVDDWASRLTHDERAALFGGNAARCYGIAA